MCSLRACWLHHWLWSWLCCWCSAPITRTLVLILPTSEGWQAESTPPGVNSVHLRTRASQVIHPNRKANTGFSQPIYLKKLRFSHVTYNQTQNHSWRERIGETKPIISCLQRNFCWEKKIKILGLSSSPCRVTELTQHRVDSACHPSEVGKMSTSVLVTGAIHQRHIHTSIKWCNQAATGCRQIN